MNLSSINPEVILTFNSTDNILASALLNTKGIPLVKNLDDFTQTNDTSLKNRLVENEKSIDEILHLISTIKIETALLTKNVQDYKTSIENFITWLYERKEALPNLKTVTFGTAQQPYIHLAKLHRIEGVSHYGMAFSG